MPGGKSDAELIFALKKSSARRTVLTYLINIYPGNSYPSEIARKTCLRINEVCGALNGSPNRYKKENSLVNLGLVEKVEGENLSLYVATDAGKKAWELFRE